MFQSKQSEPLNALGLSVGIATYRRERVLLDTIDHILRLPTGPTEIIVVDQTSEHEAATDRELTLLENQGRIRWIRLPNPSITRAMNVVLEQARHSVVLFLDDDVVPSNSLITAHARAHTVEGCNIVAGQVLQPGEESVCDSSDGAFRFCTSRQQYVLEFIGCNFSVKRELALRLGGFDENFVHVAYRFEAEFAARAISAGEKILFEPEASIRHLKAGTGGTRAYGNHLVTIKPSHSVGEYYYLLRSKQVPRRLLKMIARPLRAIRTKYHLLHPWWIPGTLIAETCGFLWAVTLAARGPRLIGSKGQSGKGEESEVKDQRSEVGSRKSEVRGRKSEAQSAIRNSQSAIPHD